MNPDVHVTGYRELLTRDNIFDILRDYDFVLDGTDNFATKFLINDACVLSGKPYSHGGILRFEGQTFTYLPGTACYRCSFHTPPPKNAVPTCSQAGVLGSIAGILGTIQATEALKFLIGKGQPLTNSLLSFNALTMEFRKIRFKPNPKCPICGTEPTITSLQEYELPVCELKQ
jgi:molybdopterin/thiamine biosynthesis adenylyltransferase